MPTSVSNYSPAEPSWTPSSWRRCPLAQSPIWPDGAHLGQVEAELATKPPLVFAGEARRLQESLALASKGEGFLLQAGDCAESFHEGTADAIQGKLRVILQMAVVLTYGAGVPVIQVGRIAGQFAKPRSEEFEERDGVSHEVFRGHLVNSEEFSAAARTPDPERMLGAYNQSAATLNLLRSLTTGGFAALSRIHAWNQEFVANSPEGEHYEQIASDIDRALGFMRACGIDLHNDRALQGVDFYTSHEALILPYEQALTRRDSLTGAWYDCSAHFLWVGDRTRQLDGAHVSFLSGLANPLGMKVGPSARVDDILHLVEALNPDNTPGRLTLISRMGKDRVTDLLGPLIAALRDEGRSELWTCDPMHANTFITPGGHKTRRFEDVLAETSNFFALHRELGTWPGGLHVELTGENVTECLGGGSQLDETHLDLNYTTMCDPRLNATQSLDLAFCAAKYLQDYSGHRSGDLLD